jgi:hypothetical protein
LRVPDGSSAVLLALIVKDSDSWGTDKDCATIYRTNRFTFVVQGDRRDEPEVVAQAEAFVPGREGLLEVPETLVLPFVQIMVKELYGFDLGEPPEAGHRPRNEKLVKTADVPTAVLLTLIVKDSDSWGTDKDCATIYRTNRFTFVVQGDRRDEPEIVAQAKAFVPGREGLLEVPETLVLPFVQIMVKELYGIDLGEQPERVDRRSA